MLGRQELGVFLHKKCAKCGLVKYYDRFSPKRVKGNRTIPMSYCKNCQAEKQSARWQKVKDCPLLKASKAAYDSTRTRTVKDPYYTFLRNAARSGTPAICTEAEFYSHYEKTQCDICSIDFFGRGMSQKCIDHCHESGKIRGALCRSCNSAEGYIRTIENARKLVEYLERSNNDVST